MRTDPGHCGAQGRRISYRKWSVSHKPVFDGTKSYDMPKEEEADKMDDKDGAGAAVKKGAALSLFSCLLLPLVVSAPRRSARRPHTRSVGRS